MVYGLLLGSFSAAHFANILGWEGRGCRLWHTSRVSINKCFQKVLASQSWKLERADAMNFSSYLSSILWWGYKQIFPEGPNWGPEAQIISPPRLLRQQGTRVKRTINGWPHFTAFSQNPWPRNLNVWILRLQDGQFQRDGFILPNKWSSAARRWAWECQRSFTETSVRRWNWVNTEANNPKLHKLYISSIN